MQYYQEKDLLTKIFLCKIMTLNIMQKYLKILENTNKLKIMQWPSQSLFKSDRVVIK